MTVIFLAALTAVNAAFYASNGELLNLGAAVFCGLICLTYADGLA